MRSSNPPDTDARIKNANASVQLLVRVFPSIYFGTEVDFFSGNASRVKKSVSGVISCTSVIGRHSG